jgi:RsiW-degrading membrane proteinase PrsW (M82 family)
MDYSIYFILLPFALIGSIMAYLITYNEYIHHYQTKKEPKKMALDSAIFTFVIFSALSFIIIYTLINYIDK